MHNQYVVVADSVHARIFKCETLDLPLIEVTDLVHPEARRPNSELSSDRPPRIFRGRGEADHPVSAREDPHTHEVEAFARELVANLEASFLRGEFDRLIIAAPPKFLGKLREELPGVLAKHVERTLDKNLLRLSEAEIREQLND